MGVTNKSLDSHLQIKLVPFNIEAQKANGATGVLAPVSFPCRLEAVHVAAFEIIDSPALQINVARFIPGAGFTTIPLTSTFILPAFNISGCLQNGAPIPQGASMFLLQPSDCVMYKCLGGANDRFSNLVGCVALRPTQDNIVYFNQLK